MEFKTTDFDSTYCILSRNGIFDINVKCILEAKINLN